MKKLFTLITLTYSIHSSAQITLEHTYYKNYGVTVVNIEGEGSKYYMQDTTTKNLLLYNDDHSLWKTVILNYPSGATRYLVSCVANKLVDSDNEIEVAYSYYTISGSTATYTTKIVNEDGSLVKDFPGIAYLYPYNVNGNWKLFGNTGSSYTEIYSVPGKYLSIVRPGTGGNDESTSLLYPNPMETSAMLKYTLPAGTHSASLSVYDMQGRAVRSYLVTDQFSEILVGRDDLPAGMYTYKLYSSDQVLSTEKFTIK